MAGWKKIVCACVLIAAVAVIFIAPAYTIQPTALRAWNASLAFLAAIGTLILLAVVVPARWAGLALQEEYLRSGIDRFRLTCALLI